MNPINFVPNSVLPGPVSNRLLSTPLDLDSEEMNALVSALQEKLSDYIALTKSDGLNSELVKELSLIHNTYEQGVYINWLNRIHRAAYKGENTTIIEVLPLIDDNIYSDFIDFASEHVTKSIRFVKQVDDYCIEQPQVIVSWENDSLNPVMLDKNVFCALI